MAISVSTWNYLKHFGKKADFKYSLTKIKEQGFGAELWLDWGADPLLFHRSNWEEIKELCTGLKSLSAHSSLIHNFSLETLFEEIALCSFLHVDPLVCHPRSLGLDAGTWDFQSKHILREKEKKLIGRILTEAAGQSVRIALENGPMNLLEQVLEMMADHPAAGQLGICIDTGHANMHRNKLKSPALEFIRHFRHHLIHLHLHDNGGEKDDHRIPGQGTIDWTSFFHKLDNIHFKGEIVFELISDEPSKASELARAFVQNHSLKY